MSPHAPAAKLTALERITERRVNSPKCARCGLVNFRTEATCKRCGASLDDATDDTTLDATASAATLTEHAPGSKAAFLFKRAAVVCGVTALLLFACYVSLVFSSAPLNAEQRRVADRAIDVLDQRGFSRDALILRRLVNYRASDNWWNRYVGHADAYAATNFPFEVVTLYPEFFNRSADDTERAAILLHEAQHLRGAGEEDAFTTVWRAKRQLGWTHEGYGHTRVWRNVTEFTIKHAPKLFRCGPEGDADCYE